MCDEEYMLMAIDLAMKAEAQDEVPVGAIILYKNKIIASGFNTREKEQNPVAHAEFSAIIAAAKYLKSWRLIDCTLYVTLEPCPMCAGAIINARIPRVVFGAYDSKAGALGTMYNLAEGRLNHTPQIIGGVLEQECADMLKNYFKTKRK